MLVLSRKEKQTIRIGDDVTVEVRRIAGNRVKVAIAAPPAVKVLRGELTPVTHHDGHHGQDEEAA